MSRPKLDNGRAAPPAHARLTAANDAIAAIYRALCEDGTAVHLTAWQKIKIARRAIGNVIDGDKPPSWLFPKGADQQGGGLGHLWAWATRVAREELRPE